MLLVAVTVRPQRDAELPCTLYHRAIGMSRGRNSVKLVSSSYNDSPIHDDFAEAAMGTECSL